MIFASEAVAFESHVYAKVQNAQVTDEVHYMSATEEQRHVVAQANANLDETGKFVNEMVNTRQAGEYTLTPTEHTWI